MQCGLFILGGRRQRADVYFNTDEQQWQGDGGFCFTVTTARLAQE